MTVMILATWLIATDHLLIGAPLQGVEPARAGVAAGMLSTTQQFAGVTGIAALGSAFFAALGAHPDRAAYARAAELDDAQLRLVPPDAIATLRAGVAAAVQLVRPALGVESEVPDAEPTVRLDDDAA